MYSIRLQAFRVQPLGYVIATASLDTLYPTRTLKRVLYTPPGVQSTTFRLRHRYGIPRYSYPTRTLKRVLYTPPG
ncbi:MAG TPA: hypothetical protein VJU86_21125, partial [Pyrinomonadaceae bacterium]|nr:hypothetical protein [Pyrinomonadaceae bacterium]